MSFAWLCEWGYIALLATIESRHLHFHISTSMYTAECPMHHLITRLDTVVARSSTRDFADRSSLNQGLSHPQPRVWLPRHTTSSVNVESRSIWLFTQPWIASASEQCSYSVPALLHLHPDISRQALRSAQPPSTSTTRPSNAKRNFTRSPGVHDASTDRKNADK